MVRRSLVLSLLLLAAMAVPMSASQFIELPFDQVARDATLVVRATVGPVTSAWDDAHEVIFSTARVEVKHYLAGDGPNVLMLREVGGTVDGYTQEAVGFPTLREGQEVVLFLSKWEDGADWRIHAYNQGKYIVREMHNRELVMHDPVMQGDDRSPASPRVRSNAIQEAAALDIDELEQMVRAARQAQSEGPRSH
ncbi:MAG TPA: hypothetical protein VGR02_17680 [Thermoanaerobaculia bacterium]|jgi:hypothetical protein|nr:hypothetical protein [Thermoanaerobaculia bacterium]